MTLRQLLKEDGADLLALPVHGAILKASVHVDKFKNQNSKSEAAPHHASNPDIIRMVHWVQEIPLNILREILSSDEIRHSQQLHKSPSSSIIEGHEYCCPAEYLNVSGGKGAGAVFSVKFSNINDKSHKPVVEIHIKQMGSGYEEKEELVLKCGSGPSCFELPLIVDTVNAVAFFALPARVFSIFYFLAFWKIPFHQFFDSNISVATTPNLNLIFRTG
jgi:hypothetical protein